MADTEKAAAQDTERPQFGRVRQLFDAAVELSAGERQQFLDELDAADEALRAEVSALLEAHDRADEFLEGPTLPFSAGDLDTEGLIGARLGDYRIERLLGRGGMGAVFLAQRADGAYEQQVAIKLLERVDHETQSVRRFQRERQTLAQLTHPHIARLLDGGTTGDGTPFLVMEYVQGEHIDRFCDRRRLDVGSRLRLFLQVCAGVQHAHRHLVVHRDLKPGNILVNEEGDVKLLDFGIAKLLGDLDLESPPRETLPETGPLEAPQRESPRQADATVAVGAADQLTLTAAGQSAFTPGYASPEQLRGESVSAASDVYALGLVLHELVVGFHPYGEHHRSLVAMTAAILGQETRTPSLALTTTSGHAASEFQQIAADRCVDVSGLRRQVQGDLDAILLKALAKDESRRYASAGDLALDIERHLEGRPVAARAGERGYVALTQIRRHRLAIGAALLLLLSLVGGLATTAWQARRAERAQQVAERRFDQVQELANALLFDVHDAIARLPGATPARHLLVERALVYLDSLRADVAGDADLQLQLASAYERIGDIQGNPGEANLGDTEAAAASYRKALELRLDQPPEARQRPGQRAAIAGNRHRIGEIEWWIGDTQEAARQLELAIAEWSALFDADSGETAPAAEPESEAWRRHWADSLVTLGNVLAWNSDHDEALQRFRAAEELLEPLRGDGRPAASDAEPVRESLALVHQGRGETLGWMGDIDGALVELEQARQELASLSAADPLDAVLRRRLYLVSLRHAGFLAERSTELAIGAFRDTLDIARELTAADPTNAQAQRDLSLAHVSFGDVYSTAGDSSAALEHFRQGQEIQRQLARDDPHNLAHFADLANSAVRIGYVLAEQDEILACLDSFDEALEQRQRLLAADPGDATNRRGLAIIHSVRGDVLSAVESQVPADQQVTPEHGTACDAYSRSLELWRGLEASQTLRGFDQPQLDYAAEQVAATCPKTP